MGIIEIYMSGSGINTNAHAWFEDSSGNFTSVRSSIIGGWQDSIIVDIL